MLNHLLTPYLFKDQLRPGLCVPFSNGTHTFATDAVSFIRIPNKLIDNPLVVTIPSPVLNTLTGLCRQIDESDTTFFNIDLSQLSALIQSIPLHNLYGDCEQCDGCGEVECECCGNTGDCKECSGTGQSNTVIGQTYSPAVINIQGITFDANLINRLSATAYVLESAKIGFLPMTEDWPGAFFFLPQEVLVFILKKETVHSKAMYRLEISTP